MGSIDAVIEALSDGKWHDLNEISTKKGVRNVSITNLILALEFLVKYDFIQLNEAWKGEPPRSVVEAKLQPNVQKFLKEIELIETIEKGGKV